MKKKNELQPLSMLLSEFRDSIPETGSSLFDLILLLQERALSMMLLLMALPNALLIASIPGTSTVFGSVIILVSLQMIVRRPTLWLPKRVGSKVISKTTWSRVLDKSISILVNLEDYIRPRWIWLSSGWMEIIQGVIVLALGICIVLPIPMGNFLPGVALVFLSIGLINKDGLHIMVGMCIGVLFYLSMVALYAILYVWLTSLFSDIDF